MTPASLQSVHVGQEVSCWESLPQPLLGTEPSQGICQLAILPATQRPGQTQSIQPKDPNTEAAPQKALLVDFFFGERR